MRFWLQNFFYQRIALSLKVSGQMGLADLASWGLSLICHQNTGAPCLSSYGKEPSLSMCPCQNWDSTSQILYIQGLLLSESFQDRHVLLALTSWGPLLICLQNTGALPFPYYGREPSFPSRCPWSKLGFCFQISIYPRIVPVYRNEPSLSDL